MKTRSQKSSERQSIADLLASVVADQAAIRLDQAMIRLENRQILELLKGISAEQQSNYQAYIGWTEEFANRSRA